MNNNECPKCTLGKSGECFHCDTQNTPTPYTPTPWGLCQSGIDSQETQIISDPIGGNYAAVIGCVDDVDVGCEQTENNAHLITSAVNSYAKHCGPNAIQCAEDDLLGQALDALRTAQRVIADWRDGECSDGYVEQMKYDVLDSILARLPQQ